MNGEKKTTRIFWSKLVTMLVTALCVMAISIPLFAQKFEHFDHAQETGQRSFNRSYRFDPFTDEVIDNYSEDRFSKTLNTISGFDANAANLDEEEQVLDRMESADEEVIIQEGCTPQGIVEKLLILQADELLQRPIYSRSNTPLNRSLHDLPTFSFPLWAGCKGFSIDIYPFYNQTSKVFFTKDSPFISSYVSLAGDNLIEQLIRVANELDVLTVKPQEILPLFSQIKLQERKAGFYLRSCSSEELWSFQIAMPIYYLERNFFLTDEEVHRIRMAPFIRENASGPNDREIRELLTRHLVSDSLGIGDTRAYILYSPYNNDYLRFTTGVLFTFPTAHAFVQGLIGGAFCKNTVIPPFKLQDPIRSFLCTESTSLIAVSEELQAINEITNLSFAVLDRLTANVATISLGNNGHFEIGPVFEGEYRFADCFGITSQLSVHYLAPAQEDRFFLKEIDPAEFNRDFTDPALAEENLAFFNSKLIETLFPTVLKVKVRPGVIVQYTTACDYTYDCFSFLLGYDFWWQGKEEFSFVEPPPDRTLLNPALNPPGMQQKVFGGAQVCLERECNTLCLGLRGDLTVSSSGIGRDFTLAFTVQFLY